MVTGVVIQSQEDGVVKVTLYKFRKCFSHYTNRILFARSLEVYGCTASDGLSC